MALRDDRVTLAHGGGGKAMRDLIEEVFTDVFEPPGMEDQARLEADALAEPGARLAFTTDDQTLLSLMCHFAGEVLFNLASGNEALVSGSPDEG